MFSRSVLSYVVVFVPCLILWLSYGYLVLWWSGSCVVLCCLLLSCHFLPCLALPCLALPCLVLSRLVLSSLVLSCLVLWLSCLVIVLWLSCLVEILWRSFCVVLHRILLCCVALSVWCGVVWCGVVWCGVVWPCLVACCVLCVVGCLSYVVCLIFCPFLFCLFGFVCRELIFDSLFFFLFSIRCSFSYFRFVVLFLIFDSLFFFLVRSLRRSPPISDVQKNWRRFIFAVVSLEV
jgi:hypothetical protein